MAKKPPKPPKPRRRICFVPGCRDIITGGKEEFFCPRHIRMFEALRSKKRDA